MDVRRDRKRKEMTPSDAVTFNAESDNKKQKKIEVSSPPIQHITLTDDRAVQFHFRDAAHAATFLSELQSDLKLQNSGVENIHAKHKKCWKSCSGSSCFTVKLSPAQYRLWQGNDFYSDMVCLEDNIRRLNEVNDFDKNNLADFRHAIAMPPVQLNQLALLVNEDGNGLPMLLVQVDDDSYFKDFLSALYPETCNQIARQKNREGNNIFGIIPQYVQALDIYIAMADRVTDDVLEQAITGQTESGWWGLVGAQVFRGQFHILHNHILPRLSFDARLKIELSVRGVLESSLTTDADLVKLNSSIIQHPEIVKELTARSSQLQSISFHDGGQSQDSWSQIAKNILARSPEIKRRKQDSQLAVGLSSPTMRRSERKQNLMSMLELEGWKFLRLQGRTILLKNNDGDLLAVKIQKAKEAREELIKEHDTTRYLRQQADKLKLQSALPTPLQVSVVTNVLAWVEAKVPADQLAQFKSMVGEEDLRSAYVYSVDPAECDYFTYLHDAHLSDDVFHQANRRSVHDLFTLLQHGVVFPQLADIFHNLEHVTDRDDAGRYIVLANITRGSGGTGRLTGWKEAVNFPNVRASGLADLGDRASINEFIDPDSDRVKKYYSQVDDNYGNQMGNHLLANLMAEYQYVLFLIAGRRGCELEVSAVQAGKSAEEINAIWQKLARQIVENCAQAISIITHRPEEEMYQFLTAMVDVNRIARQMKFWMTNEYVSYLKKNQMPDDIYGPGVRIDINIDGFRRGTFHDVIGCAIDGVHPDLGPVNGQEPIKEANKLFYWMVNVIFTQFLQLNRTYKDVHEIVAAKDTIISEALRKNAFKHLPEKQYNAIQAVLCEARLQQTKSPLSPEMQDALKTEAKEHKEKWAATVITQFWRNHRHATKQVDDAMDVDEPKMGMGK